MSEWHSGQFFLASKMVFTVSKVEIEDLERKMLSLIPDSIAVSEIYSTDWCLYLPALILILSLNAVERRRLARYCNELADGYCKAV